MAPSYLQELGGTDKPNIIMVKPLFVYRSKVVMMAKTRFKMEGINHRAEPLLQARV